jgi:alkanesulfonate monooxygenase
MQKEYQEGTLREKLYGQGRARLRNDHPAATYRIQSPARLKLRRSLWRGL